MQEVHISKLFLPGFFLRRFPLLRQRKVWKLQINTKTVVLTSFLQCLFLRSSSLMTFYRLQKTVSRFRLMTSTAHLLNRVLLIGYARSATCTLHRNFESYADKASWSACSDPCRCSADYGRCCSSTAYSTTSCICETPARVDGGDCAKRIELGKESEYAEWVDEDIVDLTDIELPVAPGDLAMPTVSVDEHLKNPWCVWIY